MLSETENDIYLKSNSELNVPVTIDTTTVKGFVLKTYVSTECSIPEDKIGINRLRNTAGKWKILGV